MRDALSFGHDFLWGAATAGHQVEGNNVNSDIWLLENLNTTVFKEPSGDACNSFVLWEKDLDIARDLGLTCYRFSLEWARIEPAEGRFSPAMLDHYQRIIDGCHTRGMEPVVTVNHFSSPLWFARQGGWTNPQAADHFERYCAKVGEAFAAQLRYVITFNEPNILRTLDVLGMPDAIWTLQQAMLDEAASVTGDASFTAINACNRQDFAPMMAGLIAGHKRGRAALKKHNPALQVGFSLALLDDQAAGDASLRDRKREENYADWIAAAKDADFIGVQNYERVVWGETGPLPVPDSAQKNKTGSWIDPTSLANAAEYIHQATGKPVMVTEHGLATDDDAQRAAFLEASLLHLAKSIDNGLPLLGYIHWTLLDNFEWVHGYNICFGLCEVNRTTYERIPKPSALHYRELIKKYRNQ